MEDEYVEVILVEEAIHRLCMANPIWAKNRTVFWNLDPRNRVLWWRRAKQQAELGVPAMQTLLLKVIELRLTEMKGA